MSMTTVGRRTTWGVGHTFHSNNLVSNFDTFIVASPREADLVDDQVWENTFHSNNLVSIFATVILAWPREAHLADLPWDRN